MITPNDLLWWCPTCHRVAEHRHHGARRVERLDLGALRRRQRSFWLPSQLEAQ